MKVVILAGGLGTRLSEETSVRPKPMVEIGGKPILWHIMKSYSHHGVHDFIVCLGYKGYLIKEFFANYLLHVSDVTIDLGANKVELHQSDVEPWRITLVDTGDATQTGGRLMRIRQHLGEDPFCLTYGDGLADVDIAREIEFHRHHGRLVTICAVQPPGRFGALDIDGERVASFQEKPEGDGAWINGGFFVVAPRALDLIEGDTTPWEQETLPKIAARGDLMAYRHSGFWQPMDTLRDKQHLESLWTSGKAPWKQWA